MEFIGFFHIIIIIIIIISEFFTNNKYSDYLFIHHSCQSGKIFEEAES